MYNFLFSFSFYKCICISIDVNICYGSNAIKLFQKLLFGNYRENASEKQGGREEVRAKTQQAILCSHPPIRIPSRFPSSFSLSSLWCNFRPFRRVSILQPPTGSPDSFLWRRASRVQISQDRVVFSWQMYSSLRARRDLLIIRECHCEKHFLKSLKFHISGLDFSFFLTLKSRRKEIQFMNFLFLFQLHFEFPWRISLAVLEITRTKN